MEWPDGASANKDSDVKFMAKAYVPPAHILPSNYHIAISITDRIDLCCYRDRVMFVDSSQSRQLYDAEPTLRADAPAAATHLYAAAATHQGTYRPHHLHLHTR